jgi:hypothetical protein
MADFCKHHCHERSIPELEARLANLQGRPQPLSPTLQKEKQRVEDVLSLKLARRDS